MEALLAQCSVFLGQNFPPLLGLFLAGLVGSMVHCSVMCAPLAAAQMLDIEARKRSQSLMVFYHAGRLTSYAFLGVAAFLATRFFFSGQMVAVMRGMMMAAGIVFLVSALLPKKTHQCCPSRLQKMQRRIDGFSSLRLVYLLRGLMMGFMPCGMIVAAFLIVATFDHGWQAALGMVLFGVGTLPALHSIGFGALWLGRQRPSMAAGFGRVALGLNGIWLCAIGANLVAF